MDRIKGGMIKDNSNKFAAVYRLIDICIIHISVYIAALLYSQPYSREYFTISLLGSVGFALIAESFSLYRSWRVGALKELTFYTLISWSFAAGLVVIALVAFIFAAVVKQAVAGKA